MDLVANFDKKANWSNIPYYMREGLREHIVIGRPVGDFLYAILTNDLMEAAGRADDVNIHLLAKYASFLHNYAPIGCFGSKEIVSKWRDHKGLSGLNG